MYDVAGYLFEHGQHADAEHDAEQAATHARVAFGDGSPDLARILSDLARVRRARGDLRGALRAVEEAARIAIKVQYPSQAELAEYLGQLGQLHHQLGDPAAARTAYRNALPNARSAFGRADEKTAEIANDLAAVDQELAHSADSPDSAHRAGPAPGLADLLLRTEPAPPPTAAVSEPEPGAGGIKAGRTSRLSPRAAPIPLIIFVIVGLGTIGYAWAIRGGDVALAMAVPVLLILTVAIFHIMDRAEISVDARGIRVAGDVVGTQFCHWVRWCDIRTVGITRLRAWVELTGDADQAGVPTAPIFSLCAAGLLWGPTRRQILAVLRAHAPDSVPVSAPSLPDVVSSPRIAFPVGLVAFAGYAVTHWGPLTAMAIAWLTAFAVALVAALLSRAVQMRRRIVVDERGIRVSGLLYGTKFAYQAPWRAVAQIGISQDRRGPTQRPSDPPQLWMTLAPDATVQGFTPRSRVTLCDFKVIRGPTRGRIVADIRRHAPIDVDLSNLG
jgi:hypothetical protein